MSSSNTQSFTSSLKIISTIILGSFLIGASQAAPVCSAPYKLFPGRNYCTPVKFARMWQTGENGGYKSISFDNTAQTEGDCHTACVNSKVSFQSFTWVNDYKLCVCRQALKTYTDLRTPTNQPYVNAVANLPGNCAFYKTNPLTAGIPCENVEMKDGQLLLRTGGTPRELGSSPPA